MVVMGSAMLMDSLTPVNIMQRSQSHNLSAVTRSNQRPGKASFECTLSSEVSEWGGGNRAVMYLYPFIIPASFCWFSSFSNKHQYDFQKKLKWKNVHPVNGDAIRTHNLQNTSLLPPKTLSFSLFNYRRIGSALRSLYILKTLNSNPLREKRFKGLVCLIRFVTGITSYLPKASEKYKLSSTIATTPSVWPDVRIQSIPNFSISCTKAVTAIFTFRAEHFKMAQKLTKYLGNCCKNFFPIHFKNRPIWSHWTPSHYYTKHRLRIISKASGIFYRHFM